MVLGLLESHNDDQTFALWLDAHRLKIAELLRISQGPPPPPERPIRHAVARPPGSRRGRLPVLRFEMVTTQRYH